MLNQRKKQQIITKFKTHDTDTGSSEVQIAILSEEIKELTKHLQQHKHDHSSRRGLLKKVGERRRLLRYLEIENDASYHKLIKELGLKPSRRSIREAEIKRVLEEEEAAEDDLEKTETTETKDNKNN
ncbi:30S ribosomal protein S15 [Candidatus Falkowbacteria bacterium]|nr:30S ribosomal protein S15 [Candidatus Falkowbacteria bacterium]MBT5502952.1 30S ribosomal protein S15 [Candidatus Falkowbacteria bacterium]MBT6574205.1 30S ribosomal protein S15 [Candidatus Falkowbacteria bacterium]MBT7348647.1 30S ribosomal protein S15 [Candidatus Falkowbacteria bacterium]MBT7500438.1 30S ribosomal protein S15 [Candidatus Falkowbacteria bacterium]